MIRGTCEQQLGVIPLSRPSAPAIVWLRFLPRIAGNGSKKQRTTSKNSAVPHPGEVIGARFQTSGFYWKGALDAPGADWTAERPKLGQPWVSGPRKLGSENIGLNGAS